MPSARPSARSLVAAGLSAGLLASTLAAYAAPAQAAPSGDRVATQKAQPAAKQKPKKKPATRGTVPVRLIGFNDLHGNLEPPSGSSGRVTVPGTPATTVDAGGAAYLATHVERLRSAARNSVVVSAGDAIGASPVISALFHDEPTVEVLNQIGVQAMALGNHELDEGYAELQRIQGGGCHPVDGCDFRSYYDGTDFPILGANVTKSNGRAALLPSKVVRSGGMRVGIIGVTLKGLPDVVAREGIRGLEFGDEVAAIDRTSAALQRQGVKAQVVLVHQGDDVADASTGPNACSVKDGGPATAIATRSTSRVDAFMTAHSHQGYNCVVTDPAGRERPMIQGLSFGRLLSVVDLRIDRRTKDVVRSATRATNEVVTRTVTPDAAVTRIIDQAKTLAAPLANRPVGDITADITRTPAPSGETPLGNVIADAQLAATQGAGAQVALMNPGGVRADLVYAGSPAGEGDGVVTYGEAFSVQPFGNVLQTVTLTGAQLKAVLEQQFEVNRVLQPSSTLTYSYSTSAPVGSKVSAIRIGGTAVDPAASYRVTINNFLSAGGDGFTTLTAGTSTTGGEVDLDAFIDYLADAQPAVAPAPTNRITVLP